MSAHGVEDGAASSCTTAVTAPGRRGLVDAARYGFDDAVLLNSGSNSWSQKSRPTATSRRRIRRKVPGARAQGRTRRQDAVVEEMGAGGACLINALGPEQHRGDDGTVPREARPRPGQLDVPSDRWSIQRRATCPKPSCAPPAGGRRSDASRVITFCGGDIAASSVGFALQLLGREDVAIYDASLESRRPTRISRSN